MTKYSSGFDVSRGLEILYPFDDHLIVFGSLKPFLPAAIVDRYVVFAQEVERESQTTGRHSYKRHK